MTEQHPIRLAIGVTGASGSGYAQSLLLSCIRAQIPTYLVFSPTAQKVIQTEISGSLLAAVSASKFKAQIQRDEKVAKACETLDLNPESMSLIKTFAHDDFYAPIASGSLGATHMAVVPCSMGTMSRIAHGMSGNLIERCADVMLKEKRKLVMVPRESPLSLIHLKNMTSLAESGAHLVPAMPGFYHNPKTIDDLFDFMTERVAQCLGIEEISKQNKVLWNSRSL